MFRIADPAADFPRGVFLLLGTNTDVPDLRSLYYFPTVFASVCVHFSFFVHLPVHTKKQPHRSIFRFQNPMEGAVGLVESIPEKRQFIISQSCQSKQGVNNVILGNQNSAFTLVTKAVIFLAAMKMNTAMTITAGMLRITPFLYFPMTFLLLETTSSRIAVMGSRNAFAA